MHRSLGTAQIADVLDWFEKNRDKLLEETLLRDHPDDQLIIESVVSVLYAPYGWLWGRPMVAFYWRVFYNRAQLRFTHILIPTGEAETLRVDLPA